MYCLLSDFVFCKHILPNRASTPAVVHFADPTVLAFDTRLALGMKVPKGDPNNQTKRRSNKKACRDELRVAKKDREDY
jgi:hypothetical protein